jgi:hypothetical protein
MNDNVHSLHPLLAVCNHALTRRGHLYRWLQAITAAAASTCSTRVPEAADNQSRLLCMFNCDKHHVPRTSSKRSTMYAGFHSTCNQGNLSFVVQQITAPMPVKCISSACMPIQRRLQCNSCQSQHPKQALIESTVAAQVPRHKT